VFTPRSKPYIEFSSGEETNNWLLENAEVRAFIDRRQAGGLRPKIAMVFFDEETERICDELGYDLILPSAQLRNHLDSKLVTTRLANEVGVASVPNVLTSVHDWPELAEAADRAGLGSDLVVQTPYGDSGKTTFFISSEAAPPGHPGTGSQGDEADQQPPGGCRGRPHPPRHGDRPLHVGDVLVDTDADEVYLGELNPRISGASAITNVTAGAYADMPLFAFHLLEFMDVDFDFDVGEINDRWEQLAGADVWSQMIIKETSPVIEHLETAALTGQYSLDGDGALVFRRAALDWHQLQNESEAFFLRISGAGDYRWKGADLGVLVTKGRLQMRRAHPAPAGHALGYRVLGGLPRPRR
jgi:hypothetical protein